MTLTRIFKKLLLKDHTWLKWSRRKVGLSAMLCMLRIGIKQNPTLKKLNQNIQKLDIGVLDFDAEQIQYKNVVMMMVNQQGQVSSTFWDLGVHTCVVFDL